MKVLSKEVSYKRDFKKMRLDGKRINFRYLFGGGSYGFGNSTLKAEWTQKECREYIQKKGLRPKTIRGEVDLYFTVADDMRDEFFNAFPGLKQWHEDSFKLGRQQGFVRSPFGARRLLPELMYLGEEDDGGKTANLEHISLNSPVQNFEICIISNAMLRFHNYCKENNLKSKLFVTVHDEIGYYIHKSEPFMIEKAKEFMEEELPEYKGVPITTDGNLADPNSKDSPTYWSFGEKV